MSISSASNLGKCCCNPRSVSRSSKVGRVRRRARACGGRGGGGGGGGGGDFAAGWLGPRRRAAAAARRPAAAVRSSWLNQTRGSWLKPRQAVAGRVCACSREVPREDEVVRGEVDVAVVPVQRVRGGGRVEAHRDERAHFVRVGGGRAFSTTPPRAPSWRGPPRGRRCAWPATRSAGRAPPRRPSPSRRPPEPGSGRRGGFRVVLVGSGRRRRRRCPWPRHRRPSSFLPPPSSSCCSRRPRAKQPCSAFFASSASFAMSTAGATPPSPPASPASPRSPALPSVGRSRLSGLTLSVPLRPRSWTSMRPACAGPRTFAL